MNSSPDGLVVREQIIVTCVLESGPGREPVIITPFFTNGRGMLVLNVNDALLEKLYLAGRIKPAEAAPHA